MKWPPSVKIPLNPTNGVGSLAGVTGAQSLLGHSPMNTHKVLNRPAKPLPMLHCDVTGVEFQARVLGEVFSGV